MLKSIVAGAKATLNRAGEWDYMPQRGTYEVTRQGQPADSDKDEEAHPSAIIEEEANSNLIAGRFSVSRSLSQLGALTGSGASACVNKAMMPLTRALKGDPETTFARDSLTKYRNQLSSALGEASAATARRKEERSLLVEALEAQENNLRCWGYLSVLPTFREHRRRETARAEIRVGLAEHQTRIIAVRHEEVVGLLKSMPVLWHWSKPSAGTAGTAGTKHGRDSRGGTQERDGDDEPLGSVRAPEAERDGERVGGGVRSDRTFEEEAIIVPPSDLLASDPGLVLTRRQLRACDEACAAAADAFARKVVDAGGLEPRSHEERSQIFLALLSRYDVVVRTIGAGKVPKSAATRSSVPSRPAAQARPPGDGYALVSSKIPHDTTVETGPGTHLGTWDSKREGDNGGDNHDDDDGESCHEEAAGDGRRGVPSSGANHLTTMSSCPRPSALASPNQDVEVSKSPLLDDAKDFALKSQAVDALGGNLVASREQEEEQEEEDGEAEMLREGRKACEDAFLELLSDERTREGRLLRRFLAMALAAASDGGRPLSASLRDPEKRTAPVKVGARAAGSGAPGKGNKEGDGAVRPKVVKAFINYFSKEYLKERFDIPGMLLPALSKLVASLVFRQARALVLGYDGDRVKKSDRIWREKAGKMRSLSLPQLGVPSEYVPARAKLIDGVRFQGGFSYFLGVSTSTDLTLAEGKPPRRFDGAGGQTESGVTLEEAVAIVGGTPGSRRRGGGRSRTSDAQGALLIGAAGSASVGGNAGALLEEQEQEHEHEHEQEQEQEQEGEKVDMRVGSHPRAEVSVSLVEGGAAMFTGGVGVEGPEGMAIELGPLGAKGARDESVETARTGFVEHQIAAGTRGTSLITPKMSGCSVRDRPSAAPGVGATAAEGGSESADSEQLNFQMINATRATQDGIVLMDEDSSGKYISGPLARTPVHDRGASMTTWVAGTREARGLAEYGDVFKAETETASMTKTPKDVRGRLDGFQDGRSRGELENGEERLSWSTGTTSSLMTPSSKAAGLDVMPRPYYSASREFSRIGDCITPDDILAVVKEGMASLTREAVQVSARSKPLDADSLLPLLVYALVHANVPRIHEALNFVRNFRGVSGGGEHAYYLTSMEAAVSFALGWTSDDDSMRSVEASTAPCSPRSKSDKIAVSMSAVPNGGPGMTRCDDSEDGGDRSDWGRGASAKESNRTSEEEEGLEELIRLGIFLENHEVQEKTVDGLSSVGWI